MNVKLTSMIEDGPCVWCEKSKQCIVTHFDDGFIEDAPLCWSCLQKAVKVRSRREGQKAPTTG